MCRETRVFFVVLANALMALGAFIAVIVGDITLEQILIGSACGLFLSVFVLRLFCPSKEATARTPREECWCALNDQSEGCKFCADESVA